MEAQVPTSARAMRDVTDDEVAFYRENGWVKLDGLVPPETAAALLEAGRRLLEHARAGTDDPGVEMRWLDSRNNRIVDAASAGAFTARHMADGPFHSFALSEDVGRNAHRLIGRSRLTDEHIAVLHGYGGKGRSVVCKFPIGEGGANRTPFHQDTVYGDRVGRCSFWIALDEVTPEMGSMRFISGSHREGPLGSFDSGFAESDLVQQYPGLEEFYELSPPLHYRPGDATVHHEYTVHGTPDNTSTAQRWCYIVSYLSADVLCPETERGLSPVVFSG